MELTKEQIQYIDHRLENEGIKYWDIRIEMLDHIVTDIENNSGNLNFKDALENTLKKLNWHRDLTHLNTKGWQNVNKYYRKMYFKGFVDFFKKPKTIIFLGLFLFGYFLMSELVNHTTFLKISYLLFFSPFVLFACSFYQLYKKKYGKSVHKDYGLNYLMLSFLMLNAVITFIRIDGGFPQEFHKVILFILIPVHLIFMYSGYLVYKKAIIRVEKMRNELLS